MDGVTVGPLELPPPRWGDRPIRRPRERIVAVGDVHGCYSLLRRLMRAIDLEIEERAPCPTRIVFLGDFVDRGPDSDRVATILRSIDSQYERAVVLLGNHEATLLASARGDPDAQRLWLEHGGLATLASYGIESPGGDEPPVAFAQRIVAGVGTETLDWIEQLPRFIHRPPFYFCHAGIRPGRALERQVEDDLLWIRRPFLESNRRHGAIVVHGHSVSEEVDVRANRIGVDTGAYRTGRLSAVILEPGADTVLTVDIAAASAASLPSEPMVGAERTAPGEG